MIIIIEIATNGKLNWYYIIPMYWLQLFKQQHKRSLREYRPYSKMATIFNILLFVFKSALLTSFLSSKIKQIFYLERGKKG